MVVIARGSSLYHPRSVVLITGPLQQLSRRPPAPEALIAALRHSASRHLATQG